MCRIALLSLVLILVSCAQGPYKPYAREVKKKPGMTGVIALKTDHVPEDRSYADTLMSRNCGDSTVTIVEEGEVEVGETTASNSTAEKHNASAFKFGGINFTDPAKTNTATTATTTKLREWQINYNCTAVAKATAPKGAIKKK